MKRKGLALLCAVILLGVTGCTSPLPPMKTATPSPTPTVYFPTATPLPTEAPTDIPTGEPTEVPTEAPTATAKPTAGVPTLSPTTDKKMKVNVDAESTLRVRSTPSSETSNNIIGYLKYNDVVLMLGLSSTWAHIRTADGTEAYCSYELLTETSADAALSPLRLYTTATPVPTGTATATPAPTPTPTGSTLPDVPVFTPTTSGPLTGYVIGVNAGHQQTGDSGKEPMGPGSTVMKSKVSGGTQGTVSHVKESQVTLDVALLLKDELVAQGATVVMIRTKQNVNISNMTRALIFNQYNVDLAINIHCNYVDSANVKGVLMVRPATSSYPIQCEDAAKFIKEEFIAQTGAKSMDDLRYDNLSSLNWSTVPVALIEMGFMSNAEEDVLLASAAYQSKCAKGIADGIVRYCAKYAPFDR